MLNTLRPRHLLIAVLLIAVLIATASRVLPRGSSPDQEAADNAAIRVVWSELDTAWNERNVETFINLYTDDVSFVFVDRGQKFTGRAEVQQRFAVQFPSMAPDLRHVTDIQTIRRIAADAVGVDGTVEILRPGSNSGPETLRRFSIFAVMVRQQQTWKIQDLRIYQLPTEIGDG